MAWNHSSEATANASRTRQKPPSARELAQAAEYRGFTLIRRGVKVHLFEPAGPYGARWLAPCYSETEARAVVDQMTGGAA